MNHHTICLILFAASLAYFVGSVVVSIRAYRKTRRIIATVREQQRDVAGRNLAAKREQEIFRSRYPELERIYREMEVSE